ncbi:MAG: hypothetical protein Q7J10_02655 [Methanosarcinaceae archaeon]|nr:hypothetical protein [Methanosarcinaceae archaeon]
MRSKIMKMFAYLAIVLMVLSTLPAGALAAEDDEDMASRGAGASNYNADQNMTQNQTSDRLNATDDAPRNEVAMQTRGAIQSDAAQYMSAKERIETTRNNYADAKNDFEDMKIKINNKTASTDSPEAVEATRAYMNHTIEYMIAHLETVRENAENAGGDSADDVSETIDEFIAQLQEQQRHVESAQTGKEFADAAKEVRKIWADAEKSAKYFAGESVNSRLNNFLVKSEGLSLRLESEIERLNAEGKDTEELEEMLAEYNEKIDEAKQNQELAREAIQNRNGQNDGAVSEANQYMHQATKNIQDANKVLKEIFDELKSHRRGGSVSLDGAGTLTTEGNGTAVFSGNLNITINATNAKLVVKDLAGDAEINITGDYTLVNDDEDEENDDNNRAFVYHNFTGTVNITGSRLTVMVNGENLSITAEGDGSSILSGRGSYNVEKAGKSSEKMMWAGNYVEESDDDDENETDDDDENETEDDETMGDD